MTALTDNTKSSRAKTERYLGLYYYCKQPGYIAATYPNKGKPRGLNKIQEINTKSKN